MYFCYFVIISPWKRMGPFIWKNLNPLHPRILFAKYGWNWLSGSGGDFLISSLYFHYFVIISPRKKVGPFIWINLNPLHPRMFCANFGWNRPIGYGEENENVKSLRQRRQQWTQDKFWSEKLNWAFGLGEPKTHLSNGTLSIVCLSDQRINPQILIKFCIWYMYSEV